MRYESDFLVIGSGIAGLSFALRVAEHGSVALVTKKDSAESATNYAQGGIAAVIAPDDSFETHVQDTLDAGAGLCRPESVRFVIERGPGAIAELIELGVSFDRGPGEAPYDLGREGGHTRRRVLHTADATGQEIERALVARADAHPRIQMLPNQIAVDLVTTEKLGLESSGERSRVVGAYVLDEKTGQVSTYQAPIVLLATGGCGKVYLYTSNPDIASGDGIAMAYRAGATISNMEFIQFHPTCVYHPDARSFLVTEAVRGEGGVLRNRAGEPFMRRYDERGDLATRDVVARSIDFELKRSGEDCVFLDCTELDADFVRKRFPSIYQRCLGLGLDMTQRPLPVVPAAHYCCGGIRTGLSGETDLENLFAVGEAASTGLHGANRLASNSLLEGVVLAQSAADEAIRRLRDLPSKTSAPRIPDWDTGDATDPAEAILVNANWDEIRRFMWNYVGIVRSEKRLARAQRRISMLRDEIRAYYWDFVLTPNLVELRNLAAVAELIIRSAIARKESRGLHYTLDHPGQAPGPAQDTLVRLANSR